MNYKERQIIDGLILSDGCLSCKNNARITFTLKHRSFADAIINSLPSISWSPIRETSYFDKRTGKAYQRCSLKSRVHTYLTDQFYRWYDNKVKHVPKDILITPTTLLWWYLGDGHLHRKKNRPNYRRVCLSTDSFSFDEVDMLIKRLKDLFGTSQSIYEEHKRIMIGRQALCNLAQMLNNQNQVADYNYKFDFGQYLDSSYLEKSYQNRPLAKINEYRKLNNVREFDLELLEINNG